MRGSRRFVVTVLANAAMMFAAAAFAQPTLDDGMTPAQARARLGVLGLTLEHVLPRDAGLRDVRLNIVIPPGPPPRTGWPVLYLLDGNATLQAWADEGKSTNVVLVGIGYDVDARLDPVARAWDYTPVPPPQRAPDGRDPRQPERRNGGADAWLDFIEGRVKPLVRASAVIDTSRQTLFGHSYGGLFVLHVLRTRPDAYQRYVAASPSLWWHAPYIAQRLDTLDTATCCAQSPRQLHLWVGSNEQSRSQPAGTGASSQEGVDRVRALATALASNVGLTVHARTFTGLGHGAMLPASARAAVQVAAMPDVP